MEVTPVGLVAVVLWFVFAWRGALWAFLYTICLSPFGMAAAFNLPALGNLSLLCFQVCAALTVMMVLAQKLAGPAPFDLSRLPNSAWVVIAIVAYSALSAAIFPRLFEGDFLVFSMNRSLLNGAGVQVGDFPSRLVPIQPSPSNLAQFLYLALSAAFYITALSVLRQSGAALLAVRALMIATFIHVMLAIIDAAALSSLLAPFRTANYSLLDHHQIAGLPRIIGGFAEASAFGAASVGFLTFFLVHFINSGNKWSGAAASLAAICALASFSSTAYFGGFCLAVYVTVMLTWRIARGELAWTASLTIILIIYGLLAAVGLVLISTPAGNVLGDVLQRIIFDKGTSMSAMERGAWSEYGYKAFFASYGLGAGVGSIRSNGFAAVYLGSIGAIGFGLVLLFFYQAIVPRPTKASDPRSDAARLAIFGAARAALVISLCSRIASATTPDLGLNFMMLAAILEIARGAGSRLLPHDVRATVEPQRRSMPTTGVGTAAQMP